MAHFTVSIHCPAKFSQYAADNDPELNLLRLLFAPPQNYPQEVRFSGLAHSKAVFIHAVASSEQMQSSIYNGIFLIAV